MRKVLSTIIGFIVGNAVNFGIINMGMSVPMKEGQDPYEAINEAMKDFTTMDFMVPLAAHVLGVFVGLFVARLICKTSNVPIYIIGGLHLLGTIVNWIWIPAPTWFMAIDLGLPILIIIYFLRTKKRK